ncbi:MAG TPA: acetolactate synthase small subunit [Deltaproteobacteria bacterium]|nr:acetolactate synthase small subunit [Deltaproteobacteria bacterium]
MEVKRHTIKLVVNNKPDVLARIAGVFSARGFNIESISANVTMDPNVTKIRIVTMGDTSTVTKIQNQLKKLVDVLSVSHVRESKQGQREMILMQVKLTDKNRNDVMKAIDELQCKIVTRKSDYCILEATGSEEELEILVQRFDSLGIEDLSRSGVVAL